MKILSDDEYQELMLVRKNYELLKSVVFCSLKQARIVERNKILDTFRYFLPCYKKQLAEIDRKIDELDELEELLR